MKKTFVLLFAIFMLAGCGGDGGGGEEEITPPIQPTKAVLTLSTQGTPPAGTFIGGIEMVVNLPAGVTVPASPAADNPSVMVTTVVEPTGGAAGALVQTIVTAASTTSSITIMLVKPDGLPAGAFATVKCDIAAGSNPATTDFSLSNFRAVDLNGLPMTGLTAGFSAAIQ